MFDSLNLTSAGDISNVSYFLEKTTVVPSRTSVGGNVSRPKRRSDAFQTLNLTADDDNQSDVSSLLERTEALTKKSVTTANSSRLRRRSSVHTDAFDTLNLTKDDSETTSWLQKTAVEKEAPAREIPSPSLLELERTRHPQPDAPCSLAITKSDEALLDTTFDLPVGSAATPRRSVRSLTIGISKDASLLENRRRRTSVGQSAITSETSPHKSSRRSVGSRRFKAELATPERSLRAADASKQRTSLSQRSIALRTTSNRSPQTSVLLARSVAAEDRPEKKSRSRSLGGLRLTDPSKSICPRYPAEMRTRAGHNQPVHTVLSTGEISAQRRGKSMGSVIRSDQLSSDKLPRTVLVEPSRSTDGVYTPSEGVPKLEPMDSACYKETEVVAMDTISGLQRVNGYSPQDTKRFSSENAALLELHASLDLSGRKKTQKEVLLRTPRRSSRLSHLKRVEVLSLGDNSVLQEMSEKSKNRRSWKFSRRSPREESSRAHGAEDHMVKSICSMISTSNALRNDAEISSLTPARRTITRNNSVKPSMGISIQSDLKGSAKSTKVLARSKTKKRLRNACTQTLFMSSVAVQTEPAKDSILINPDADSKEDGIDPSTVVPLKDSGEARSLTLGSPRPQQCPSAEECIPTESVEEWAPVNPIAGPVEQTVAVACCQPSSLSPALLLDDKLESRISRTNHEVQLQNTSTVLSGATVHGTIILCDPDYGTPSLTPAAHQVTRSIGGYSSASTLRIGMPDLCHSDTGDLYPGLTPSESTEPDSSSCSRPADLKNRSHLSTPLFGDTSRSIICQVGECNAWSASPVSPPLLPNPPDISITLGQFSCPLRRSSRLNRHRAGTEDETSFVDSLSDYGTDPTYSPDLFPDCAKSSPLASSGRNPKSAGGIKESCQGPSLRRSQRQRVPRLRHFANEYIEYAKTAEGLTVKGIRQASVPNLQKKRGTRKGRRG